MKYFIAILSSILSGCLSLDLRTTSQRYLKEYIISTGRSDQKIAIIDINGTISTQGTSEIFDQQPSVVKQVIGKLELAERDPKVKAILLRISSPGGSSVASEMLYHEIKRFKQRSNKKILAYSIDVSASGAYYASIASDYIIAYPHSMVGSIGAVYVRPELKPLADKIGVKFHIYKSGSNKDMGNIFNSPSEKEKEINKNITNTLGKNFLNHVLKERKISDSKKIEKIASAQIFLAEEAQELGLIDTTGSIYDAIQKLEQLASINQAQIITYNHYDVPNDNLYNISSQSSIRQNFDNLSKQLTQQSGYYYLNPLLLQELVKLKTIGNR
jgi:protease IV